MSSKIRRVSAPILWVTTRGISDRLPDEENLLQCALQLGVLSSFLSSPSSLTISEIDEWQQFCSKFGKMFATFFCVEVNTKLHRVMRHILNHKINHGCFFRRNTEENECFHKYFKRLVAHKVSTVASLTGRLAPDEITNTILDLRVDQNLVWEERKWSAFLTQFHDSTTTSKTFFGGKNVYGQAKRHDAVVLNFHDQQRVGFVHSVFASRATFSTSFNMSTRPHIVAETSANRHREPQSTHLLRSSVLSLLCVRQQLHMHSSRTAY